MLSLHTEEAFESFNPLVNLAVHSLAREGIEALFESIKDVCLRVRCSHKMLELAIELNLEYTRVHEELDTV